ncbi:MAG TPA: hypothetical protein VN836_04050 [Verrucomicrobiae bacterium]|nr:hypothetical protein [Verrucomicrobiae bacterium]
MMQSNRMETNWAEENLQTIRTLMERSAVYRRALAPIMLFAGAVGVLATAIGFLSHPDSTIYFWPDIAMFALVGALLIARRQAIRDREPFWSPPARRVVRAMLPSWLIGIIATTIFRVVSVKDPQLSWWLPPIWMILYGLGLYGAGFFMQRGIRLLGWIFILGGLAVSVILTLKSTIDALPPLIYAHCLMGAFFGALHLTYGAYLYLTKKGKNAA